MTAETTENRTWYVAITKLAGGNRHSSFLAVGSKCYRAYKEVAGKNGVNVVAEQFDVDDETVDRIGGFDSCSGTGKIPLRDLVLRADTESGLDIQKALADLCKSSP